MVFGKGKGKATTGNKKRKGSNSNAPREEQNHEEEMVPEIEELDDFPKVVLIADKHRKRFKKLLGMKFEANSFIDPKVLDLVGISSQTKSFFRGMGLETMFNMHEVTYHSLTLEFYVVSEFSKIKTMGYVEILGCVIHTKLPLLRLSIFLDLLYPNPTLGKPEGFNKSYFYSAITGFQLSNYKHCYTFHIQHMVIRIWHRFIAGTILGRYDTGKVSQLDRAFLKSYLRVQRLEYNFSPALGMLVHFRAIGNGRYSTKGIVIGGRVIRIAEALCPGFDDDERYAKYYGGTWIDEQIIFKFHRWCEYNDEGRIDWFTQDGTTFTLLKLNMPPTDPRSSYLAPMPNYLLLIEQENIQPPRRRGREASASTQAPQPPPYQGQGLPPFIQGIQPSYAVIPPYPHVHKSFVTDSLTNMMHNMDFRMHQGHQDNYYCNDPDLFNYYLSDISYFWSIYLFIQVIL